MLAYFELARSLAKAAGGELHKDATERDGRSEWNMYDKDTQYNV